MNVRDDMAFWAKVVSESDFDRIVKLNGYQFKVSYNVNGLVQSFISRAYKEWRSQLILSFENNHFRFEVTAPVNIVDSPKTASDFHTLPVIKLMPFNSIVFRVVEPASHKLELLDWTEEDFDSMVMSLYLKMNA